MSPVALPARPPRDLRLDVLRGWMQISIFISHVVGTSLAWGIHAAWGLSDSSEMFILLSGLTLGSVFGLKLARQGAGLAQQDLLMRAWRLYRTHLRVFFMFAAMVLVADLLFHVPDAVDRFGWRFLVEQPFAAVALSATTLYQPDFMGTLPVFVVGMLVLGPFLLLVRRIGAWALLPSFLLYAATNLGWVETPGLGGSLIGFDPLAWQFLYLLGGLLGWRALHGVALPRAGWMTGAAALIVLAGFAARLVEHGFLDGPAFAASALQHKEVLAPTRLAHALALAYLVAVLVPREAGWMDGMLGRALAAIGRHSLRVFCVGLFFAWIISRVMEAMPDQAGMLGVVLVLTGIAALWTIAVFSERTRPSHAMAQKTSSG
ncbi:OpgC domain-containing protein [Sediminicoccus sp. KRV36]|uniref:OpgC domain-containing protein n=1 Tax=Sediminicoccus sp. KRV36 TaxID=3133721 RepID=UPI00200C073A|nr:OpgC domain-containing protein [Sediminicoccus rosea]UPY35447.1 OpgC domain-containing protein [Sediminicoccus rosea]